MKALEEEKKTVILKSLDEHDVHFNQQQKEMRKKQRQKIEEDALRRAERIYNVKKITRQ